MSLQLTGGKVRVNVVTNKRRNMSGICAFGGYAFSGKIGTRLAIQKDI